MSRIVLFVSLLLVAGAVPAVELPEAERAAGAAETQEADEVRETESSAADAESQTQTDGDAKVISGMSVLGNQEAPKSLVIVPWKSSELGDSLGISSMLDDSRQPVDKEVFMRALSYYEIRSEATP